MLVHAREQVSSNVTSPNNSFDIPCTGVSKSRVSISVDGKAVIDVKIDGQIWLL